MATAAVAALALICALAPATAGARFTKPEATSSLTIAYRFWHSLDEDAFTREGYHCSPTSVTLDWVQSLGEVRAMAAIAGCADERPKIWLEAPTIHRLGDVEACSVVAHEFGHLLGYRHVRNHKHVMSGDTSNGIASPAAATWRRAERRCGRFL